MPELISTHQVGTLTKGAHIEDRANIGEQLGLKYQRRTNNKGDVLHS
jgi:hypothetical protein